MGRVQYRIRAEESPAPVAVAVAKGSRHQRESPHRSNRPPARWLRGTASPVNRRNVASAIARLPRVVKVEAIVSATQPGDSAVAEVVTRSGGRRDRGDRSQVLGCRLSRP